MIKMWTAEEEASRLSERFDAMKKLGVGQAEFARQHKFPGGPSMVSQHIKGRRPMTLAHATIYAIGFKCDLAEISPRHATEVAAALSVMGSPIATRWPFKTVTPSQYFDLLPEETRTIVDSTVAQFVKANSPATKQRAPEKAPRAA